MFYLEVITAPGINNFVLLRQVGLSWIIDF